MLKFGFILNLISLEHCVFLFENSIYLKYRVDQTMTLLSFLLVTLVVLIMNISLSSLILSSPNIHFTSGAGFPLAWHERETPVSPDLRTISCGRVVTILGFWTTLSKPGQWKSGSVYKWRHNFRIPLGDFSILIYLFAICVYFHRNKLSIKIALLLLSLDTFLMTTFMDGSWILRTQETYLYLILPYSCQTHCKLDKSIWPRPPVWERRVWGWR